MATLIKVHGMPFSAPKHAFFDPLSKQFWASNCIKLANFLAAKPNSAHNQSSWAERNDKAPCGTRACALGWAALSDILPGLQYVIIGYKDPSGERVYLSDYLKELEKEEQGFYNMAFYPAVNGNVNYSWEQVGKMYFGSFVLDTIFLNTSRNKKNTIAALRYCAKKYKSYKRLSYEKMTKNFGENA